MTERRKSPRPDTVITHIEDITYSVLRSHSVAEASDAAADKVEAKAHQQ